MAMVLPSTYIRLFQWQLSCYQCAKDNFSENVLVINVHKIISVEMVHFLGKSQKRDQHVCMRNSYLYSLLISFIYLINYYYIFNKKFRCNDPIFLTKNSWQAARDFVLKWNMLLKQNIYFMKKNLTIWLAHNWPRLLNKHLKWVWTRLERVICSFRYVTSQELGKNFKSM